MRFGSAPETAMPILPRIPSGNPFPSRCFQVTPLSSDRYSPLPGPPLEKNHGCRRACQSDAKTMFGLCGSNTTSIPPVFSSFDKTFVRVLGLVQTRDRAPLPTPHFHFLDRQ